MCSQILSKIDEIEYPGRGRKEGKNCTHKVLQLIESHSDAKQFTFFHLSRTGGHEWINLEKYMNADASVPTCLSFKGNLYRNCTSVNNLLLFCIFDSRLQN